jgi:hypothetical protein
MRTITLTVGPDGRVAIPDTRPGQTVTIQLEEAESAEQPFLTLRTARTAEEKQAVIADIKRLAREIRETAPRELLEVNPDEWLYDARGLPK